MKLPIYLDYFSTTPVNPKVVKKMIRYLKVDNKFGNPSSRSHIYGWLAEEAIEKSRIKIANLINSKPEEIIFTSGATESNNLAIKGYAFSNKNKGNHIITNIVEHKSVIESYKYLEKNGFNVTWLKPDHNGIISIDNFKKCIRKDTILFSLMHVNNEIGIIQDIKKFSLICNNNNIIMHVDATQSLGKISINLKEIPIDLITFSGHKIFGPKGIGCLIIKNKNKIKISPQIHGGGQEKNIRSGTLPVHQIVGLGEACKISAKNMKKNMVKMKFLRNKIINELNSDINFTINSNLDLSLPNLLNISFTHSNGNLLISSLKDLAISSGAACISDRNETSYVLKAIGLNDFLIKNSIRISLSKLTTESEIDHTIKHIKNIFYKIKKF